MGSRPSSSTIVGELVVGEAELAVEGLGGGHSCRGPHRSQAALFRKMSDAKSLHADGNGCRVIETNEPTAQDVENRRESTTWRRRAKRDHDRAAQGCARRRAIRRSGGQELPRSTRAEPAPAGPPAHARIPSRSASSAIDASATPTRRRSSGSSWSRSAWTSSRSSRRMGAKVDLSALEADVREDGGEVRASARASPTPRGASSACRPTCSRRPGSPELRERSRDGRRARADARSDCSSTTPSARAEERRRWRARGGA